MSSRHAERALSHGFSFTIGGRPFEAQSGQTAGVVNPTTEAVMTSVPDGDRRDVNLAVAASQASTQEWIGLGWSGRAALLRELAGAVRAEAEQFAILDTLDGGNPIAAMRKDAEAAGEALEFFAGIAGEAKGTSLPATPGNVTFSLREPYGVVGRIVAYNHPFMFAVAKTAAALVAGNCVVLKPSNHTPLSALRFGRLAAEVLPPGVLNVVSGQAELGAALIEHSGVPRIAFTGSVKVARRILAAAGTEIKRLTLELGGKNPMIVCDDVNVREAAMASIAGMNFARSQGQSCQSNSRVFVHDSIHDEFVEFAAHYLSSLRIGDPLDEDTDMGPVTFAAHRDNVCRYIELGIEEGADVAFGGPGVPVPSRGFYVAPTIFSNVRPHMAIAKEEIFGPVMSIMRWNDDDQVIAEANAVDYGLTASIWCNSIARAYSMATRIEAGYVWLNKVGPRPYGVPFGGWKHSGFGKENSLEEVLSYTREKVIDHDF